MCDPESECLLQGWPWVPSCLTLILATVFHVWCLQEPPSGQITRIPMQAAAELMRVTQVPYSSEEGDILEDFTE